MAKRIDEKESTASVKCMILTADGRSIGCISVGKHHHDGKEMEVSNKVSKERLLVNSRVIGKKANPIVFEISGRDMAAVHSHGHVVTILCHDDWEIKPAKA